MALKPLRAWDHFWFGPISARPLGAYRITVGCLALINLAFLTIDLDYWLTGVGLLQGTDARELAGPLRPSPLHWFQDPMAVRGFLALHALVTLLFTLGWRTRLMGVLVYLGQLSIHQRNIATASGADVLLMVSLFYLMISPCGAAYSLDARREARRRGTVADPLISPWAQRLIQIQLTIMYLVTSIFKCAGTTWLSGTALHFVVCNREVGRFDVGWVAAYPALVNVLTYGGLAIEFALAFFLWNKAARPWVIAAGISLHLGIMLIVNIPLFGELSMAAYLVFLDSDDFEAIRRAFRRDRWIKPKRLVRLKKGYCLDQPSQPLQGSHDLPEVAPAYSKAWGDHERSIAGS